MNAKPYEATWESLKAYEVPAWFKDAKLGIFIHWGPYAVPAFHNEWYPRNMYVAGSPEFEHHREVWGDHQTFGYKDFIPMFKAEKWDPEAWVSLFKAAGARYVVPVAEHHDGFPMYDCSFTNYNAARMGPRRDVVAELAAAVRSAGLKFGVSSHRAFNYRYYTFRETFDTLNPDYHKLYGMLHSDDAPVSYTFILDWYARTRELVDRFSPDVLWFDFGWHRDEFEPWRPRVAAYYYNHAAAHSYEPVLQYKDKFPDGVAVLDVERGKLEDIRPTYWQTDTSVSYKSWCYVEDDEFRSPSSLVHDLVDIVSKNGNLLLNVGPRPDGTLTDPVVRLLEDLGAWLAVNGEAVYGTRPWKTYGEGPTGIPQAFQERAQQAYTADDVRFTTKDNVLYAVCLGWPDDGRVTIRALASGSKIPAAAIRDVALLGAGGDLAWSQDERSLNLQLPEQKPASRAEAYTFKITLDRPA
jgi:alpha-L-fucosidase